MAQQGNINVNGLSIPVWDMQSTAQQIDDTVNAVMEWQEDPNNPGCYYHMVDAVQEWINPPMVLGVEYRTIERYQGNPIYKIAWPAGDFPNNTVKTVTVDTGTTGKVSSVSSRTVLNTVGAQANGMYGNTQSVTSNFLGMFLQGTNNGEFIVMLGSNRNVTDTATIFIDYTRG